VERDGVAMTYDGRLFQRRADTTGNARSATVDSRVHRTAKVCKFKMTVTMAVVISVFSRPY